MNGRSPYRQTKNVSRTGEPHYRQMKILKKELESAKAEWLELRK